MCFSSKKVDHIREYPMIVECTVPTSDDTLLSKIFFKYQTNLLLNQSKFYRSLPTTSLQYVSIIRFSQATIDCLITNKTKNALHKETVI